MSAFRVSVFLDPMEGRRPSAFGLAASAALPSVEGDGHRPDRHPMYGIRAM